jgi:ATP-dependent exoDNAse (exonuclease V) beta subunit
MVDEFQDTTRPQFGLLQHMVERHRNLAVVGDPCQSIHSWNGADPRLRRTSSRSIRITAPQAWWLRWPMRWQHR